MGDLGSIAWFASTKQQSLPILKKIWMCLSDQADRRVVLKDGILIFSNGATPLLVIQSATQNFTIEIFITDFFEGIEWVMNDRVGDLWYGERRIEFAISLRRLVSILGAASVSDVAVCFCLSLMPNGTFQLELYNQLSDGLKRNVQVLELQDAKRVATPYAATVMPVSYVAPRKVRKMFECLKPIYEREKHVQVTCSTLDEDKKYHRVSVALSQSTVRKTSMFLYLSGDDVGLGYYVEWPFDYSKLVTLGGPEFFRSKPKPVLYLNKELLVAEFTVGVGIVGARGFFVAPPKIAVSTVESSSDDADIDEDVIDTEFYAGTYERDCGNDEFEDDHLGSIDYGDDSDSDSDSDP